MFRDQLNEDRIRALNHMHREIKIYFTEYKDAYGKIDGAFSLEILKQLSEVLNSNKFLPDREDKNFANMFV